MNLVKVQSQVEIHLFDKIFSLRALDAKKIYISSDDVSRSDEGEFFSSSAVVEGFLKDQSLGFDRLSLKLRADKTNQTGYIGLTPTDDVSKSNLEAFLSAFRKNQHIDICKTQDVEASDKFTGFSRYSFIPSTFPELNWSDIDIETEFLGHKFSAPLFVTGMTGGIKKGGAINKTIALACEKHRIPMGVGSQRIALEHPEYSDIFDVKKYAPNIFLIANIGASQLSELSSYELCQRAVDMIEADALAVHVNVLQELIQVEGDRNFAGLFSKIQSIAEKLSVPLIVKEVGSGMDPRSAQRLYECGVSSIDVGGRGGTSWGYIEGLRTESQTTINLSQQFRDWGIPTAYSVAALKNHVPKIPITATGGIRNGQTAAKAVALGATMAGIGLPIFRAAEKDVEQNSENSEELNRLLGEYIAGIKMTCLLTGSKTLKSLSNAITEGCPYENSEQYNGKNSYQNN